MKEAWMEYFRMFPDYFITIERKTAHETAVGFFGTAQGTYSVEEKILAENFWKIPASWLAVVEHDRIVEWRVYADLEPIHHIMKRPG